MTQEDVSPATWQLRVLDGFSLLHEGEIVKTFGISRPDSLLAYLAMFEGYTVPRADVAQFLWPTRKVQAGRKLLTEVLFRLNQALAEAGAPDDFITGDKQLIGLSPYIKTDLASFKALAREHATSGPEDQRRILQKMEELYGRGLLPLLRAPQIEQERASLDAMLEQARERMKHLAPTSAGHHPASRDLGMLSGDLAPIDLEVLDPPMTETNSLSSLDRLCRLHAERCAVLARDAEPHLRGLERQIWVRRLDRHAPHLHRALEWVTVAEAWELGFRIAAPIWRYWLSSAHWAAGRAYLDEIVVRGHTREKALHAKALQGSGALAAMAGDYPQALRRLDQALGMWHNIGDRLAYAQTLEDMGVTAYRQGLFAEAQAKYTESLEILQELGASESEMNCLKNAALVAIHQHRVEDAQKLLIRRLTISREHQDSFVEADSLINLATVAQMEEKWSDAERFADESLKLFQELQAPRKIGFVLRTKGNIFQHTGRADAAQESFQSSLDISRRFKHLRGIGESFRCLGELFAALGEQGKAHDHLKQALAVLEADGDIVGVQKVKSAIEFAKD